MQNQCFFTLLSAKIFIKHPLICLSSDFSVFILKSHINESVAIWEKEEL
jgi:hypothetical protein